MGPRGSVTLCGLGAETSHGLRARAMGAMLTAGCLVALPYAVPGLERLRLLQPLPEGQGLSFAPPPAPSATVGEVALPPIAPAVVAPVEAVPLSPRAAAMVAGERAPVPIVDPSGAALDPFFAALAEVEAEAPEAHARISWWGDSNVAGDLVSSVLRRKLQAHLGDGGHGFLLLARTSHRYRHHGARLLGARRWVLSQITGPLVADGFYGLGGTSFRAQGGDAWATVGTATEGIGSRASQITVAYLAHPEGAPLTIEVDGEPVRTVTTAAARARSAKVTVDVVDGPHEVTVRAGGAHARVFGVWFERARGVVVDALGVTNSKVAELLRVDGAHWREQLELRGTRLAIFQFGVNEARSGHAVFGRIEDYDRALREVLARTVAAGVGCLVLGPFDVGLDTPTGPVSYPLLATIDASQRRIAEEVGCAYWGTREAMGGDGAVGRWRDKGLAEPTLVHPSDSGAEVLGHWLYLELLEQYRQFKAERG